ncbi:hypothetical protein GGR51DRAFT_516288 [Nemania sp. FL0031]|nr:hypothetical protein GGR51DRAFT_516288 [Nemania sp. FL0031]
MEWPAFNNPAPLGPVPQGALPWLRRSQIVNFGSQYAFPPVPGQSEKYGEGGEDEWLREYLDDIPPFDKLSYTFDLLQRNQATILNTDALQVLLQSLIDTMPREVRENVGFHMNAPQNEDEGNKEDDVGPVVGSRDWFSGNDEHFDRLLASIASGDVLPPNSNNKEFILWVVNTGSDLHNHYVTIVLHYVASDPAEPLVLDRISHWTLVDTLDRVHLTDVISSSTAPWTTKLWVRVRKMLESHGIMEAMDHQLPIIPSVGPDPYISGYVAYDLISQLLERIGTQYRTKSSFNPGEFFAPTRPWFSMEAVRAELLGRAGLALLRKLKWKARFAAFPIQGDSGNTADDSPIPSPLYDDGPDTDTSSDEVQSEQSLGNSVIIDQYPWAGGVDGSAPSSSIEAEGEADVYENELFNEALVLYSQRKQDERDAAIAEAKRADEACVAALKFARRVQHEVLESPTENMPSAYAVEKLFGLGKYFISQG